MEKLLCVEVTGTGIKVADFKKRLETSVCGYGVLRTIFDKIRARIGFLLNKETFVGLIVDTKHNRKGP